MEYPPPLKSAFLLRMWTLQYVLLQYAESAVSTALNPRVTCCLASVLSHELLSVGYRVRR